MIGILAGVWASVQGFHAALAFGLGLAYFFISIAVVVICSDLAGLAIDIPQRCLVWFRKKKDTSTDNAFTHEREEKTTKKQQIKRVNNGKHNKVHTKQHQGVDDEAQHRQCYHGRTER